MPTITRLKDLKQKSIQPYKRFNQSAKYYNSKGWHLLRNSYIRSHPLCEVCLSKGITKPAEHVHHKIEFLNGNTNEERWSLLLNEGNLMSVCSECHRQLHNR